MDLQSPSTIAAAWLLAPLLTLAAAGGLGVGISSLTGVRLRTMTLPVGYLAGIVFMTILLKLGVGGRATVAIAALAAVAGYAASWRRSGMRRPGWRDALGGLAAPEAVAAAGGFFLALAPLIGSGRSGVLGYILNNDAAVHSSLVEHLRDHGSDKGDYAFGSSWSQIAELLDQGYPIGSHVWPLFAGVTAGLDTFHVWSPSVAVAAAMVALVALAALRRLDAPRWPAAIAAMLVPAGYLFYSFIVQGGAKEVVTALAVYAAVVAAADFLDEPMSWRRLPAAGVAPTAAFLTFGAGAGAWLAGPAVVLSALGIWRLRRYRPPPRVLIAAAAVAAGGVVIALPALREALDYVDSAEANLRNPAQYGNLLGAVPWEQAFNIWFAYDYRIRPATFETLSSIGPWLAGCFATGGLAFAVYRRELALPLIVLAGVVGAVVISERYSIYLDTKAYAVLGPALGIASAAAVLALLSATGARRVAGALSGLVLGAAVIGGAALVYAGAWVTPEGRFEELSDIADRFHEEGPILVNEREEWDYYLLRDLEPVESWGAWQYARGFRFGEEFPPFLPHTPDFDDYRPEHVQQFGLLLERKGPGGSSPPSNYEPAHETPHYRVWRKTGPAPRVHLPLGAFRLQNSERLDCRDARVARLLRRARRASRPLIAAWPRPRATVVMDLTAWTGHELRSEVPPTGMINRRGGTAAVNPLLPRGEYEAWIQGSFGPGVQLLTDGRVRGHVHGDLGLPSAWHSLGRFSLTTRVSSAQLVALEKPWWQSGSERSDLVGQLLFVPLRTPSRLERIPPGSQRALCGRRLDWLEL